MAKKLLMKGNEAICEGALAAGCRFFAGYPITPQNQIPEFMSRRMRDVNGVFIQSESEVAAINMVYGASSAGTRAMTSSSSPGISLKQEGISYLAGAELPCVVCNVSRGGPGLGNIAGSQSDYFQAVKGGVHGDYKLLTLAPWSVQEMYDLTIDAFDLADRYRGPAMILADGILGQMIEPIELKEREVNIPDKPWATTGAKGRAKNSISSIYIIPEVLEQVNQRIFSRYQDAKENETRWQEIQLDDAEIAVVAYGSAARLAKSAIDMVRDEGVKAGMLRPISLFPFPEKPIQALTNRVRKILVVELSMGQLVEDVRLAVNGRIPVELYGRPAGLIPRPREIADVLRTM
jgi:2-oxoglutarate ferredoxin oxidoreductase subunit alpha